MTSPSCEAVSEAGLKKRDESYVSSTGQEAPAQENGEVSPEAESVALKCDIITIAGRADKCELAKAALLVGGAGT